MQAHPRRGGAGRLLEGAGEAAAAAVTRQGRVLCAARCGAWPGARRWPAAARWQRLARRPPWLPQCRALPASRNPPAAGPGRRLRVGERQCTYERRVGPWALVGRLLARDQRSPLLRRYFFIILILTIWYGALSCTSLLPPLNL